MERKVKTWRKNEVDYLLNHMNTLSIEQISKNLGRSVNSVNQFLHRKRLTPKTVIAPENNLLLKILTEAIKDPALFTPNRFFFDSVKIGQKKYQMIYKGLIKMTDEECLRVVRFFDIPLERVHWIRQLNLFDQSEMETVLQSTVVEETTSKNTPPQFSEINQLKIF